MNTQILIMRPDQPNEKRDVVLAPTPSLDDIKAIVTPLLDGADLERVAVLSDFSGGLNFKPADMFVDETGALKGLPRNEAATIIYRRATMLGRSAAPTPSDPEMLSAIYGPAILFSRRVWF